MTSLRIFRRPTVMLILIAVITVQFSACRQVEKITSQRTVRVDSIDAKVPLPEWRRHAVFAVKDSFLIDDERLRLEFTRVLPPDSVESADSEMAIMPDACYDSTGTEIQKPLADWFRLDYTIKPETVKVKVPQKTITEKIETTVFKKQMPNWGWVVIGILAGFLLVILIGAKVMR